MRESFMARTIVDDFAEMILDKGMSDRLIQFQSIAEHEGTKYLVQVTIRQQPEEAKDESSPQ